MPLEPPASRWSFPDASLAPPGQDLLASGADLAPGTLLAAYRQGLFPMGLGRHGAPPLGWWSPDPRGVLLPGRLHISRSLRRSARGLRVSVDLDFEAVVRCCADPRREGRWITPAIIEAYADLHRLGWAHSLEVWSGHRLVGGLYGLSIGGLFAGESMFHRATDASKVALWALNDLVLAGGDARRMLDVQWSTPHLASLGVQELSRTEYLRRLAVAIELGRPILSRGTLLAGAPTPDRVRTQE